MIQSSPSLPFVYFGSYRVDRTSIFAASIVFLAFVATLLAIWHLPYEKNREGGTYLSIVLFLLFLIAFPTRCVSSGTYVASDVRPKALTDPFGLVGWLAMVVISIPATLESLAIFEATGTFAGFLVLAGLWSGSLLSVRKLWGRPYSIAIPFAGAFLGILSMHWLSASHLRKIDDMAYYGLSTGKRVEVPAFRPRGFSEPTERLLVLKWTVPVSFELGPDAPSAKGSAGWRSLGWSYSGDATANVLPGNRASYERMSKLTADWPNDPFFVRIDPEKRRFATSEEAASVIAESLLKRLGNEDGNARATVTFPTPPGR